MDGNSCGTLTRMRVTFAAPATKSFANASVYQAHFTGKKHQRAIGCEWRLQKRRSEEHSKRHKRTALLEALISEFMSDHLADVREETRANVHCKSGRTMEERIEDVNACEEEPATEELKGSKKAKNRDVERRNAFTIPSNCHWIGTASPFHSGYGSCTVWEPSTRAKYVAITFTKGGGHSTCTLPNGAMQMP